MADLTQRLLIDIAGLCVAARKQRLRAARRSKSWEADGRCTAIGHARALDSGGRGVRQRHRGARRGLRRHVRGRAGACRRGGRPGGARGRRAGEARRARRAGGHRGGRASSCAARAWWRRSASTRRASIRPRCWARMAAAAGVATALRLFRSASSSMRWASPARWRAGSSSTSPRARGPSGMHPGLGGAGGDPRRATSRAHGFIGPRTVLEGTHGFFHGFARTHAGRLGEAHRRLRRALDREPHRLQALRLRHDDASVHRLRARGWRRSVDAR